MSVPRAKESMKLFLRTLDEGQTWSTDPSYQHAEWQSRSNTNVIYRHSTSEIVTCDPAMQARLGKNRSFSLTVRPRTVSHSKFTSAPNALFSVALVGVHPARPSTIYACFSVGISPTIGGGRRIEVIRVPGMYVSQDGGDHWTLFSHRVGNVREASEVAPRLGISPSNPNVMMGHGENGLLRTHDGGKSWNLVGQHTELERRPQIEGREDDIAELRRRGYDGPVRTPEYTLLNVSQIEFQPDDSRVAYLVTNKGLYKTETGGDSWCLIQLESPN